MDTDTAAKAAHDETNVPTVGDLVAASTEAPPEIPTAREAKLERELAQVKAQLRAFEERREKEADLLSQRDAALASIEAAKNRVAAHKQELAEVEEHIASLLREPMPKPFEETPIGKAIAAASDPAQPGAWESMLPAVAPESVRLLTAAAGDELPTVDAICAAILPAQAMEGENRKIKSTQTVQVYGTPWIVTAIWKDESTGSMRANVVRLYTKDEWAQLHEAMFGRCVPDFDQSEDAGEQRKQGGPWCGLVVKVGRAVFVVGPQKDALHLVYDAPTITDEQHQQALAAADAGWLGDDLEEEEQHMGPGIPAQGDAEQHGGEA